MRRDSLAAVPGIADRGMVRCALEETAILAALWSKCTVAGTALQQRGSAPFVDRLVPRKSTASTWCARPANHEANGAQLALSKAAPYAGTTAS